MLQERFPNSRSFLHLHNLPALLGGGSCRHFGHGSIKDTYQGLQGSFLK